MTTIWKKEGVIITNGKRTHCVGDIVKYSKDEKNFTDKWVITGVTESGQIVIEAWPRVSEELPFESVVYLSDDSDLTPYYE